MPKTDIGGIVLEVFVLVMCGAFVAMMVAIAAIVVSDVRRDIRRNRRDKWRIR